MTEDTGLHQFAETFQQEVIINSDVEEQESFREDEFTRLMTQYLIDAGEIDDAEICYHKPPMKINGYNVSLDKDCLDIFVSIFNQAVPPISVKKSQIENSFQHAIGFFRKALYGYYKDLEESSPVFDMAQSIHILKESITRVRIFLLTDGLSTSEGRSDEVIEKCKISFHIWDIERIYRLTSSGRKQETIEIDFEAEFGKIIPCLSMPYGNSDYDAYLAIIPGSILADIYEKHRSRLLERNVRSFLQARGKVNKGVLKTISNEPHRFLAYNNGISITAEEISLASLPEGGKGIKWIRNLQIVNGAQTTASIHHAAKKEKLDISSVYVPAKISVISSEKVDEVIPLISRFANSQNKINEADFYANDPFHVKMEILSRNIWAPNSHGMNRETRWFYERARGQYLDAKGRETKSALIRKFEIEHPPSQKFTKTDLAKYENTWNQLPHFVSLGAEKNFREFAINLKERGAFDVDISYFQHLIAKAILFKGTYKTVHSQKFGAYIANIVTYTLAFISHKTAQRIDLDKIWKEQSLSPALIYFITEISKLVHRHITNPPGGRNITEWCKKEQCWKDLLVLDIDIPSELENELLQTNGIEKVDKGIDSPSNEDRENIIEVIKVTSETWFKIARWAKETGNLQPWQRSLSFSMGNLAKRGREPSRKQAFQALKILDDVSHKGFEINYKISENSSEKESYSLEDSEDIKIVKKENTPIISDNDGTKFLIDNDDKSYKPYENIDFIEKLTEIIKLNPYITRKQISEKVGYSLSKTKGGLDILDKNKVIKHRLVVGKKNRSMYQYFI